MVRGESYHRESVDSLRDRDRESVSRRHPDDIVFNIPKETVGAVIGKGGYVLKELHAEFGFRVHVEKDETGVARNVVIMAPSHGSVTSQDLLAMQRCRDKVLKIVQTTLENAENGRSTHND